MRSCFFWTTIIHNNYFINQFKIDLLAKESAGDPIKKAKTIRDIVSSISKIPDTINIIREASEQGALFGSVAARDIAKAIKIDDIEVSAKDVIIKTNITSFYNTYIKILIFFFQQRSSND